jgi:sarcosine oxidase subunit delta
MIIKHPLLGPRDASEFVYKGDASLIDRPRWNSKEKDKKFLEYAYLRKNPAGIHNELWYHEHGDRSWLVVKRNTITHEIERVELARDFVIANGNKRYEK